MGAGRIAPLPHKTSGESKVKVIPSSDGMHVDQVHLQNGRCLHRGDIRSHHDSKVVLCIAAYRALGELV